MRKEIYLHIPQPCHEDWNKMSPVQQGRFCQSCSKQVIDFSAMNDKQILEVLSKAAGKTCGRFLPNQLERPIVKEPQPMSRPYRLFLSAFIPAFLLVNAGSAKAQVKGKILKKTEMLRPTMGFTAARIVVDNKITGVVEDENVSPMAGVSVLIKGSNTGMVTNEKGAFAITFPEGKKDITLQVQCVGYTMKEVKVTRHKIEPLHIKFERADAMLSGDVVVVAGNYEYEEGGYYGTYATIAKRVLKGKVINDAGDAVPFATIQINTRKNIIADSNGVFTIAVRPNKKNVGLTATSVGYESNTTTYAVNAYPEDAITITLKNKPALPGVTVSCSPIVSLHGFAGGVSIVRRVTSIDTARTFIQKAFNNEMFRTYPNPAIKGSSVNLVFKKAGDYTIQIFDNGGKLYLVREFEKVNSNQVYEITLPVTLGIGTYFIKAFNNTIGKQFVDKIIIQL